MDNLVKVEGEVIVKDGTGSMIEFYEEDFIISGTIETPAQARSLIRKGLITERLRKSIQGFRAVRTCQVMSMTPTDQTAEQSELDITLLKAIQENCVPDNLDSYKKPDAKLKALKKSIDTAKKRKNAPKSKGELDVRDEGIVG